MGFQQWGLVAQNDTIVSIDGQAVNESITSYIDNNPDYQFEVCTEATGEGYLYNATILDSIPVVFETAGEKIGAVIPTGTKPTC